MASRARINLLALALPVAAFLAAERTAWPAARRLGGGLYAAAGKVDITPDVRRGAVWLAGFGASGRRARGVHDPLYARALVVSDGSRTAALVAVDLIGLYRQDVLDVRRRLGWLGDDKYLFLAATHTHSGPDTLGLWGRTLGLSGVDRRYHDRVKDSIAGLVRDLAGRLQEADVVAAARDVDPARLCRDSRDPVVIDPELQAVQFRRRDRGAGGRDVIGTLVRWSCHPEVLGSDNFEVTADYPGALCARLEEKEGGGCVFFNGVIGGLLTPDVDRSEGLEHDYAEAKRVGERVADLAEGALRAGPDRVSGPLAFDSRILRVPVENSRYLLFLHGLTFGHRLFDAGGSPLPNWKSWWLPIRHLIFFPLPDRLKPWVETEISLVRVGAVEILGVPGEMFPELAIGGYDGKYRYGYPLVQPTNPNPPDLSKAPKGPYLRERLGAKHGLIVGLANDELGYIVPEYDFKINPNRAMAPRPPGDHYEETNSIGKSATGILLNGYRDLLGR